MRTLVSNIDNSVNFVEEKLLGFIESRYVRREKDYFIAYLSSQTGCNRGCKFCHLTTTKQTRFDNLPASTILASTDHIFYEYGRSEDTAKYVHFNFMARGEPLCNPEIIDPGFKLLQNLGERALAYNLIPKFNVSTIMPRDMTLSLSEMFPIVTPTIYYSMYSAEEAFREKWMPNAMPHPDALAMLKEYQDISKKLVKFHCAFIKDENDKPKQVLHMMRAIAAFDIKGEFNIVRYNPYSPEQGEESPYLENVIEIISQFMPCKVITRVGEDVKASCGMFVDKAVDISTADATMESPAENHHVQEEKS